MAPQITILPSVEQPWKKYYGEYTDIIVPEISVYSFFLKQDVPDSITALEFFGKKLSYKALREQIEKAALSFRNAGVKRGDIVTLCMPTTPEVYYIFFALNKLGAIANLIDPRSNLEFIERSIHSTESKILIYIDIAYDKIKQVNKDLLNHIICVSISESFPLLLKIAYSIKNQKILRGAASAGHIMWSDFLVTNAAKPGKTQKSEANADDSAAIVYTSGTTEIPKGAVLSNKNIIALTRQNMLSDFGWDRNDRFLEIMPPFIAYGLLCGIVIPVCIGMTVVIIPKFEASAFADLIIKEKPNHIMGVPSMMEDLTTDPRLQEFDLGFLKTMIVGGDKINVESEKKINTFLKNHNSSINLIKGYGMTEMSSNAVFTKNLECNLPGSVGVPLIGNNIKIIDETGMECPYNTQGEICLTGPTLIREYFKNPEYTSAVFKTENGERWIHTGDIGYLNPDGILFIEGRIKRMIIRHDGFKVIPRLIEDTICEHQLVKNCAVTGIDDKSYGQGQLPVAWIVLNDEIAENENVINELYDLCRKKLPEYEQPVDIIIIDEIPLTPIGKTNYKDLEKMYTKEINQ